MLKRIAMLAAALALAGAWPATGAEAGWAGVWNLTASFGPESTSAAMTLTAVGDVISGTSQPLDENGYFPLQVKGASQSDAAVLELSLRGERVGELRLKRSGADITGSGELYGVAVAIAGTRPKPAPVGGRTHDIPSPNYHLYYSARNPPTARIDPGDRVKTRTLDNEGQDEALRWKAMPGNTLSGPFYVTGAMPGDTLVVHIERVDLTRDSAKMLGGYMNPKAVRGGYVQRPTEGLDRIWTLDRPKGVARLRTPGKHLGGLAVPLRPMIGSIGVAPPQNQALSAGDLGFHGGNMDFQRVTSGATLYFPVYRAGALLSLGDGHAAQGDGEVTGQGLETSLAVEFKVELIKGWTLGQVWSEDADFVMVSGIDNSLDTALQMATTGMVVWLKRTYGLDDSEAATLLGVAAEYRIAEVVDTRPHVVAMVAKKTLAMLPKP
jgi:acetamidase/formamidase